jgi:hypothetical protein
MSSSELTGCALEMLSSFCLAWKRKKQGFEERGEGRKNVADTAQSVYIVDSDPVHVQVRYRNLNHDACTGAEQFTRKTVD